jgi:hypothetical protein
MESLKFMYVGLPRNWYKESKADYKISNERFRTLSEKLKHLPEKPITLYIQNGCSIFVKEIFDVYKIKGIDFVDYFKSMFDNQTEKFEIPEAVIIVVYNIGLEPALNTAYSAKLLYGLIEQIKQNDNHIFLCSHLSPSKFESEYGIDLVNKITLTKNKEEQFI